MQKHLTPTPVQLSAGWKKGDFLKLIPENIPTEMRLYNQWVLWRQEFDSKGKSIKIPYQSTGAKALTTQPKTWGAFNDIVAAYNSNSGGFDGIGFVFTNSDPFTFVDFDECLGQDWALKIINQLDSFTEVSPSGTGYHVILEAKKPEAMSCKSKEVHDSKLEVYDSGRYATFTGHRLEQFPNEVQKRQAQLEATCEPLIKRVAPPKQSATTQQNKARSNQSDNELLDTMFRICRGSQNLFNGIGSDDASANDLALCNHLAFISGKNSGAMDRLFRQSDLMRPKWDERRGADTYGNMTLSKAIESTQNTYTGAVSGANNAPIHKTVVPFFDDIYMGTSANNQSVEANPEANAQQVINQIKAAQLKTVSQLLKANQGEAVISEFNNSIQELIERISKNFNLGETKERFLGFADLMNLPQQEWIIKDLLPAKGLGMLIGASGGGKTFLALYLLAMLSQGRDFLEMSSKKTPVIYLGLEGGSGIKNRMLAVQKYYNLALGDDIKFVLDGGFSLTNASDCIGFAQDAVKKAGRGCVVCIDTLNQASVGKDENSGKDMGEIIQGLQTIQAITSGLVLVVHHLGKDRSKGARGHSSLYAACDVVLAATKQSGGLGGWLSTSAQDGGKAKDAEPVSKPYQLSQVELDTKTPEGHVMTSAVAILGVGGTKDKELIGWAKEAQNAYIKCLNDGKGVFKSGKFLGLRQANWKNEFVKNAVVSPSYTTKAGITRAKSTAFTNGVKGLNTKNLITQDEDGLVILHTSDVSRIVHKNTQTAA